MLVRALCELRHRAGSTTRRSGSETLAPGPTATRLLTRSEAHLSLFERRVTYDRKRILAAAELARAKGRNRRAIRLYRLVLAPEPRNLELHYRIAPLLAQTGQRFDAWRSLQHVASACAKGGHNDKALAVYQEAVRLLPRCFDAWMSVARLEAQLGDRRHARDSLVEGSHQMKGRRNRAKAIALLRAARDLDAWDPNTVLELSSRLIASRQAEEARWLLERLAERVRGRELARVRATQWRMEPSLRHTWYWLRDAIRARRSTSKLATAA